MISFLRGNIAEIGNRYAVVDVHDVGYKVYITDDTAHILKPGKEEILWTYLAVRENSEDLYGFPAKKDRDFFELLIGVSGIGPKTALNILSLVASDTLANAVRTGSTGHLVKVSGIGRKTAEKIVLELKDKLGGFGGNSEDTAISSDSDTLDALRALGYDAEDAREALKKIDKNISDTGAKVKAALKVLG